MRIGVVFAYEDTGAVSGVLGAEGLAAADTIYDARVTMWVEVPEPKVEAVVARLTDRTSGRVEVRRAR